jgi:peptidoglycan/xylan/chitin deacetylase (PgdA/CDA1 family)
MIRRSAIAAAKTMAKRCIASPLLVPRGGRYVFIYHDISEPNARHHSSLYSTIPSRFDEQLRFIRKYFEVVTLDALLAPRTSLRSKRLAAITFDDGFSTVRDVARPRLDAAGLPFTVFLNATAIRKNRLRNGSPSLRERVFLDESDVRSLAASGVTIGNHGFSHRALAACTPQQLQKEVAGNKSYLEDLVGSSVRHFAFPFGKRLHYDQSVIHACRDTGHDWMYSSNPIPVSLDTVMATRIAPRIGLSNEDARAFRFLINRPRFVKIDL